jgi:hypothetical protein
MSTTIIPDSTDPRVGTMFDVDGWTVAVSAPADPYNDHPTDQGDCYTDAQIAAWESQDWWYCVLNVHVSREGVQLGSSYLGGIESGWYTYTDEDDNITGVGNVGPYAEVVDDCIAEAIEEAKATLSRLCGSVQP